MRGSFKPGLVTLLTIALPDGISLRAEELADRIRSQAVAMTEAYLREDSNALTNFTAEAIVRKAGGTQALKARIQNEFESNRKEDLKMLSYRFTKPDRIHYLNGQLFALIERKSRWRYDNQTRDLRFNLLAVSTDGGSTWRFAEITSMDEKAFRDLFGFFDERLFSEFYQYSSERCNCREAR